MQKEHIARETPLHQINFRDTILAGGFLALVVVVEQNRAFYLLAGTVDGEEAAHMDAWIRFCITVFLLCTCASSYGATPVPLPDGYQYLVNAYATCLAEAYERNRGIGQVMTKSELLASTGCEHEREALLSAFPAKHRPWVNNRIQETTGAMIAQHSKRQEAQPSR